MFGLFSLLSFLGFGGALFYFGLLDENLNNLFKLSFFVWLYFTIQLLPIVFEAKNRAPLIFTMFFALLSSWLFVICPPPIITVYRYIVDFSGPLYIFAETIQIVGMAVVLGDKTADFIDYTADKFVLSLNDSMDWRRTLVLIGSIALYISGFFVVYLVITGDIPDWGVPSYIVVSWFVIAMIIVTVAALVYRTGIIIQSAAISGFLAYLLYSCAQIDPNWGEKAFSLDTSDWKSLFNSNYLFQIVVVTAVLLSIPLTMDYIDDKQSDSDTMGDDSSNDDWSTEGGVTNDSNGKVSTRLQSLVLGVIVLLITHFIDLLFEKKSLSANIFWYRIGESILAVALYLFVLKKDEPTFVDYS